MSQETNAQDTFEQLPPPPKTSTTPIFVGIGTFAVAALCGLVGISYAMMQPKQLSPRIISDQDLAMAQVMGAVTKTSRGYTPTSQYIEKGADSDITELDLSSASQEQPEDPELIDEGPSEDAIQRTITSNQMELIDCYAQGLEDNPDLAGRVDFHFRIAPDGHVAMVKITRSGLQDKGTEDCFVSKSRKWSFPKSSKKALIKFDTNLNFAAQ